MTANSTLHTYDVAVSFAGEDRRYVQDIVEAVRADGYSVFYDEDYAADLWGENLVDAFTRIYQHEARYVVMFVSRHYAEKVWTDLERKAALAGALARRAPYVLPVRLDDTQLEGLLPTVSYLDANRVGIDGIVDAIRAKLAQATSAGSTTSTSFNGKVPRNPEEVEILLGERPAGWEYLLFAGRLQQGRDDLQASYLDFAMGYAPRSGVHVEPNELPGYVSKAMSSVRAIAGTFETVLDPEIQERAFGAPGEPGDVDRISHLAQRVISTYADLLQWASDLRGATSTESGMAALRAYSLYVRQPIEATRTFIDDLVTEFDALSAALNRGDNVKITMRLAFDLDPKLSESALALMQKAIHEG